jgi:hypothetical protein
MAKAAAKFSARLAAIGGRATRGGRYPSITFEEIKDLMHKPHGPSIIRTITVDCARQILKEPGGLNAGNRPKKTGKVAEFANYMAKDNWKLTGDTLKFSDKFLLRDGQNRLWASVESKKPFVTHIVFGIDDAVFTFLDRGKSRTNADAFVIAKVPNAGIVSGAMWWLEKFRHDGPSNGNVKDRSAIPPDDALAAYKKHYNDRLMKKAVAAGRSVSKAESKAISVTLYYLFAKTDESLADEFFLAWSTRNYGGRMVPIKKAAEYLAGLQKEKGATFRVRELARFAAWIEAWNLVVRKQKGSSKSFVYRANLPFPTILG